MRDINLGTCATIVGTTTACTPLPPSNVEICLCHTASSGHLCFSTLLGGRGALGSGERGTWERIGSFFKSSKDLLHYSMLFFRNVPSIFDLHCRWNNTQVTRVANDSLLLRRFAILPRTTDNYRKARYFLLCNWKTPMDEAHLF